MATRKRIRSRSPAVSGGGTPVVTAATITIGPDYGTPNEKVELHMSSTYTETQSYPIKEEVHIGPEKLTATYPMTEELHIAENLQASYAVNEELSLRPVKVQPNYPMTEELKFNPPSMIFQQTKLHEELQLTGTQTGPPQFEAIVTTGSTATPTNIPFTGITTLIGAFLLAVIGAQHQTGVGSGTTMTPPAGWTEIRNTTNAATQGISHATFWRVVAAADPSSWTFVLNQTADQVTGGILQFSGVKNSSPINVSAASTGNSTVLTAPAVTATKPNCMMVACGSMASASTVTFAPASPYVQRMAFGLAGTISASCNSEACTHVQMTSGASGTEVINTGALLANVWITNMIALNSTSRVLA